MKLFALGLPLIIFGTFGFFTYKLDKAAGDDNKVTFKEFVQELQPITPAGAQKYNN